MKKTFKIKGLDCANCASKMENGIKKIVGVNSASINFMTSKLIIEADEDKMEEILVEAQKVVSKVEADAKIVKG